MTKQTTILISVVLSCTMFLLLFIPSFADDSVPCLLEDDSILIKAGTYQWLDVPSFALIDYFPIPFTSNGQVFEGIVTNGTSESSWAIVNIVNISDEELLPIYAINYGGLDGGWQNTSLRQFTVLEDTYVPSSVGSWFDYNTTLINTYEGNPFVDIIDMVIEALDVSIFGSFSLWDMLTTLCGLFAVVWLLKLLAGG